MGFCVEPGRFRVHEKKRRRGVEVTKQTAFGAVVLKPKKTGNRRRDMRIPTGSMVLAKPSQGRVCMCMVKDVGEGGICVEWHTAPVNVGDNVLLVFEKRELSKVQEVERESIVKWYSPNYVGLAFTGSPTIVKRS